MKKIFLLIGLLGSVETNCFGMLTRVSTLRVMPQTLRPINSRSSHAQPKPDGLFEACDTKEWQQHYIESAEIQKLAKWLAQNQYEGPNGPSACTTILLRLFDVYPIFQTIAENNIKIFKLLLKFGADVNVKNCSQDTPLHAAAEVNYNSHEMIQLLINNGADLRATGYDEETPFARALETLSLYEDEWENNPAILPLLARKNFKHKADE